MKREQKQESKYLVEVISRKLTHKGMEKATEITETMMSQVIMMDNKILIDPPIKLLVMAPLQLQNI